MRLTVAPLVPMTTRAWPSASASVSRTPFRRPRPAMTFSMSALAASIWSSSPRMTTVGVPSLDTFKEAPHSASMSLMVEPPRPMTRRTSFSSMVMVSESRSSTYPGLPPSILARISSRAAVTPSALPLTVTTVEFSSRRGMLMSTPVASRIALMLDPPRPISAGMLRPTSMVLRTVGPPNLDSAFAFGDCFFFKRIAETDSHSPASSSSSSQVDCATVSSAAEGSAAAAGAAAAFLAAFLAFFFAAFLAAASAFFFAAASASLRALAAAFLAFFFLAALDCLGEGAGAASSSLSDSTSGSGAFFTGAGDLAFFFLLLFFFGAGAGAGAGADDLGDIKKNTAKAPASAISKMLTRSMVERGRGEGDSR
mmetsp:Transcript_47929/g.70972  ORF Transcript_47929/g.70972 Transcript_47929/m.70972 type:complete len:367 (+) Transcript_47929:990-2090(+)